METLEQPTPFLRDPYLDGCDYAIRFGSRYQFPCFVLVEENRSAYRNKFEDLRLYPLTGEGKEAATADLHAIETDKRKLERETRKAVMREEIQKRFCRYCRYYPKHETESNGCGSFTVCQRPLRADASHVWTLGGVPTDRIIYNSSETCNGFEIADEYKGL